MSTENKASYLMSYFQPKIEEQHLSFVNDELNKLESPEKFMAFLELKKPMTAILWALFFGHMGAGRFYIGHTKQAVIMLVLSLTIFGLIITLPWMLVDLFFISGATKQENFKKLNQQLIFFK